MYIDSNQAFNAPIHWLPDPNFVGSFDIKDKIYFFFRETAVEHINCGKVIHFNFDILRHPEIHCIPCYSLSPNAAFCQLIYHG